MKQILYYDKIENPARVRIKSEKFALDHTYEPDSCSKNASVEDLWAMLGMNLVDEVLLLPKKESAYFDGPEGLVPIDMWINLKDVSDIRLGYWSKGDNIWKGACNGSSK